MGTYIMNRRGFLKSIASVAGAKALAPLAPLAIEAYQLGFSGCHIHSITFPEPGKYPIEIECNNWHFSPPRKLIILKARSCGITYFPANHIHRTMFAKTRLT